MYVIWDWLLYTTHTHTHNISPPGKFLWIVYNLPTMKNLTDTLSSRPTLWYVCDPLNPYGRCQREQREKSKLPENKKHSNARFCVKIWLGRQHDYECVYKEGFDTQHDCTLGLDMYVTGLKEIPAHSRTPDSQCVSFLAFPKKVPISY